MNASEDTAKDNAEDVQKATTENNTGHNETTAPADAESDKMVEHESAAAITEGEEKSTASQKDEKDPEKGGNEPSTDTDAQKSTNVDTEKKDGESDAATTTTSEDAAGVEKGKTKEPGDGDGGNGGEKADQDGAASGSKRLVKHI